MESARGAQFGRGPFGGLDLDWDATPFNDSSDETILAARDEEGHLHFADVEAANGEISELESWAKEHGICVGWPATGRDAHRIAGQQRRRNDRRPHTSQALREGKPHRRPRPAETGQSGRSQTPQLHHLHRGHRRRHIGHRPAGGGRAVSDTASHFFPSPIPGNVQRRLEHGENYYYYYYYYYSAAFATQKGDAGQKKW